MFDREFKVLRAEMVKTSISYQVKLRHQEFKPYQYFSHEWRKSGENKGLASYSEQVIEHHHAKFFSTWAKYKVKHMDNPTYSWNLFSAVVGNNGKKL